MLIFAIFNVFHNKTINEEYFPTKFDNYFVVHEELEHITYFAPTVPHKQFCTWKHFFLSVNR